MANVLVDPGALLIDTSLGGTAVTSVLVDSGVLLIDTSLGGTAITSVLVDPGALLIDTSFGCSSPITSVLVDPGELSIGVSLHGDYSFMAPPDANLSVYSDEQLKMTKEISTEPDLSGDVVKKNKIFVNVQGSHLTVKLESSKQGRNFYLIDLHAVISIISGR